MLTGSGSTDHWANLSRPQDVVAPPRADGGSSGLQTLLAEELVRRREFSHKLLRHFNRSPVEGASGEQLVRELQKVDGLIATLIGQCQPGDVVLPPDVDKRDKGQKVSMASPFFLSLMLCVCVCVCVCVVCSVGV